MRKLRSENVLACTYYGPCPCTWCDCRLLSRTKNTVEMPAPFSTDLRWRIAWMKIAHDLPMKEIATMLELSERSVRRIVKLFKTSGDV